MASLIIWAMIMGGIVLSVKIICDACIKSGRR